MSGQYVGRIKMRYIGKPNGVYMKGAWGGYVQNAVYSVPADYIQYKFWELVESPPEIRAPEPRKEDSVFKDEIFLPPSELTSSIAPTPVLTPSLQVGEVTQSTQEKPLDAVEQAKEKALIEGLALNGMSHRAVEQHQDKHDDKTNQEGENAVMEQEQASPLTEDDGSEMPPELVAEMRAMGDEILGDPLPERKIRRRKKNLSTGDGAVN